MSNTFRFNSFQSLLTDYKSNPPNFFSLCTSKGIHPSNPISFFLTLHFIGFDRVTPIIGGNLSTSFGGTVLGSRPSLISQKLKSARRTIAFCSL